MALYLDFIRHRDRPSHSLSLGFLLEGEARLSVHCTLQINQLEGLRLGHKFKLPYVGNKNVVDFSEISTTARRAMNDMKRGFFTLVYHNDAEVVLSYFFGLLGHDPCQVN